MRSAFCQVARPLNDAAVRQLVRHGRDQFLHLFLRDIDKAAVQAHDAWNILLLRRTDRHLRDTRPGMDVNQIKIIFDKIFVKLERERITAFLVHFVAIVLW